MAKRRSEMKAGIMIVVCFALFLVALFTISDIDRMFRPRNLYVLSCEKVAGLEHNAPVRYAGFQCGRVTEVSFEEPSGSIDGKPREKVAPPEGTPVPNVWVHIELDGDVRLKDTDHAVIKAGFTGNVFVDVLPAHRPGVPSRVLAQGAVLPAQPRTLDEIVDRADEMRGEISSATAKLNSALEKADAMMPVVEKTVQKFHDTAESVNDFVSDNRTKLDETVENARLTSKNTREIVEGSREKITGMVENLHKTAEQASQLLADLKPDLTATARNLEEMSRSAREHLAVNRSRMDKIVENLREASARLNIGMEDIRRNPWKLLSRNINADPKTQNIYDAALAFSDAARSLSQTCADLKVLSDSGKVDPRVIQEASEEVGKLVENLSLIEQEFYRSFRENPAP